MPIVITKPDWSQSAKTLRISLEMKGVKSSNISWIHTNLYLKVLYLYSLTSVFILISRDSAPVGGEIITLCCFLSAISLRLLQT